MANKVLEALINIAGQVDPSLQKSLKQASSSFSGLKKAGKVAGVTIAAGLAAGTAAAVAAAKQLYDLGARFDEAKDTIRIGTGATGEALDSLYSDMEEVYKNVPTTMEDASKVISDYNTRLDLTGEPLQKLSQQALQVSNMLDEDLTTTIEDSSKAFSQWNLDSEDMSDAMDYIFKVSQSTGMGFNDLMGDMQSYGAQLQDMGYDFNTAAALMGQLDKAGVNTKEVLGAMKKSVTSMAKEGISASDGLKQYYDSIMNAKDATEATSIASEIFGSRAASTMAAAIRDGTLSVDDLTSSLQNSSESINGAASDTYDFAEQFQILKQNAQVALEPIATEIFNLVNEAFPYIKDAFDQLLPVITNLAGTIVPIIQDIGKDIFPILGKAASQLGDIFAQLGPQIGEYFKDAFSMISNIMPIVMQLVSKLLPVIMKLLSAIIPIINSVLSAITPVISILLDAIDMILPVVSEILTALTPIISTLANLIATTIVPIISTVFKALSPVLSLISTLISSLLPVLISVINTLSPVITFLGNIISTYLGAVIEGVVPVIQNIINVLQGVISFITDVFFGNWSAAWTDIISIFQNIFEGIINIAKIPINAVVSVINAVIGAINGFGFTIPDWVPFIGGKSFSLDIPELPTFGEGGFTAGPSIAGEAGGTEAVISFDPAYRQENLSYWAKAGQMLGAEDSDLLSLVEGAAGGTSVNEYNLGGVEFSPQITIKGNASKQDVMDAIREVEPEFFDLLEEFLEKRRHEAYGTA